MSLHIMIDLENDFIKKRNETLTVDDMLQISHNFIDTLSEVEAQKCKLISTLSEGQRV